MQSHKFKFIKMEPLNEGWSNVKCSNQTCDANIIKGNSKNIAYVSGNGKSVRVIKHGQYGRIEPDYPVYCGHKGNILDLEFVPYHENYFATSSEDGAIKLWEVQEQQKTEISTPLVTMEGHNKKVNLIHFNPSAECVLASSGLDRNIRVWDVQNGVEKYSVAGSTTDYATDIQWKNSGDLIGSTWKDKQYRISDPRQNKNVHQFAAHEGSKPSKFSWMGDYSYFVTAGFSRGHSQREFKFWDLKKPDTPVSVNIIDKDMSVIYPYFDHNLDILYFTGKGDSMIRYFDYTGGKFEKYGNDHRCKVPGKAYSFVDHYCLDTHRNEIAKAFQVNNNDEIQQISITQPKRASGFSEDIYPDSFMKFGQSADQFFNNHNAEAIKFPLNPDQNPNINFQQPLSFVQGEKKQQQQVVNQDPQQQQQVVNQPPQQQQQKVVNQPPVQEQQQQNTVIVNQVPQQQQNEVQQQDIQQQQTVNQPPQQVIAEPVPQQPVQQEQNDERLEQQRLQYEEQISTLRSENEDLKVQNRELQNVQSEKTEMINQLTQQIEELKKIVQ